MARWSKKIENSISIASREVHNQDFLEAFFDSEVYIPHNEKEEEEFGEFSLVISSMALLIYVASAGKEISETVKKRIISDLIFQLEQRPYEFVKLTDFGQLENEIVTNVFERMKKDYEENFKFRSSSISLSSISRVFGVSSSSLSIASLSIWSGASADCRRSRAFFVMV